MNTAIRSTDKARFTRCMPLPLKSVWKLGEFFKLPLTFNNPDKDCKSMYQTTVATTAMFGSLVEYRYIDPFTKEYAHGLIDINIFLQKAKK